MFQFNLKDTVRDTITGFEGVVVARTEWHSGCVTYQVKSKSLHEGKPIENFGFDEPQLELVKADAAPKAKAQGGGPTRELRGSHL